MSPKKVAESMKENPLYVILASVLLSYGGVTLTSPTQDSLSREMGEVRTEIIYVRADIERVEKDGKERDEKTQKKLEELNKKLETLLRLNEEKKKKE